MRKSRRCTAIVMIVAMLAGCGPVVIKPYREAGLTAANSVRLVSETYDPTLTPLEYQGSTKIFILEVDGKQTYKPGQVPQEAFVTQGKHHFVVEWADPDGGVDRLFMGEFDLMVSANHEYVIHASVLWHRVRLWVSDGAHGSEVAVASKVHIKR